MLSGALFLGSIRLSAQSFISLLPDSDRADLSYIQNSNRGFISKSYNIEKGVNLSLSLKDSGIIGEDICAGVNSGFCVYYRNNSLSRFNTHLNNCTNGVDIQFYENGTLKCYGNNLCLSMDTIVKTEIHRFDTLTLQEEKISVTENSLVVKTGKWFYYKPNGQLQKIEQWDKGSLKKEEDF